MRTSLNSLKIKRDLNESFEPNLTLSSEIQNTFKSENINVKNSKLTTIEQINTITFAQSDRKSNRDTVLNLETLLARIATTQHQQNKYLPSLKLFLKNLQELLINGNIFVLYYRSYWVFFID